MVLVSLVLPLSECACGSTFATGLAGPASDETSAKCFIPAAPLLLPFQLSWALTGGYYKGLSL